MASPIAPFTVPANQVGLISYPSGAVSGAASGSTEYTAYLPNSDDPTTRDPTGWGTSDGNGYIESFTFTPDASNPDLLHVTVNTSEGETNVSYGAVTLTGNEDSSTIAFAPDPNAAAGTDLAGYGLLVSNTTIPFTTDPQSGLQTVTETLSSTGGTFVPPAVSCFAAGTLILTSEGEVPVESLKVGELAITSSGVARAIRWIGHRRFKARHYPQVNEVWPVLIEAGAFAPGLPNRDLRVSPGHGVGLTVLDELLIPAGLLINGATIRQEPVDEVTYYHVELETPDMIMANGLPAESYIDVGNRSSFISPESTVATFAFSEIPPAGIEWARPKMFDHGTIVRAVKERLAARAMAAGWTLDSNLENFHAIVDGQTVQPVMHEGKARFLIPAGAKDVRLVVTTSTPVAIEGTADGRPLGVAIDALVIDDGLTGRREIALDDPRLNGGFHGLEQGFGGRLFRWTSGEAQLPASLWQGCLGHFFLQLGLISGRPCWTAPVQVSASRAPLQRAGGR